MRRGASYMDRRQQFVQQQASSQGSQQSSYAPGEQQQPGEQPASGPNMGHRSSIAGWRQFSTEKLIGIKQKVADWNPLGSGRSKSFLGFAQGMLNSERSSVFNRLVHTLSPEKPVDYRCDNRRFWLSAHNCQVPTPMSQNLEQQIRIFPAD